MTWSGYFTDNLKCVHENREHTLIYLCSGELEIEEHGITRQEIAALLTQAAFYAGWPNAWAGFRIAKEVWTEDSAGEDAKAAFQREMIFPVGEPNTAFAKYFTGNSYLARISTEQVAFSNVTFEPRCR